MTNIGQDSKPADGLFIHATSIVHRVNVEIGKCNILIALWTFFLQIIVVHFSSLCYFSSFSIYNNVKDSASSEELNQSRMPVPFNRNPTMVKPGPFAYIEKARKNKKNYQIVQEEEEIIY